MRALLWRTPRGPRSTFSAMAGLRAPRKAWAETMVPTLRSRPRKSSRLAKAGGWYRAGREGDKWTLAADLPRHSPRRESVPPTHLEHAIRWHQPEDDMHAVLSRAAGLPDTELLRRVALLAGRERE